MVSIFYFLLVVFPLSAGADIFVASAAGNTTFQDSIARDRSGYYLHSTGLDTRHPERKVSDIDAFLSGTLIRDRGLYDVDGALLKEFDESFSSEGPLDKYKMARNKLLLLEYSSPALADVIKHYRMMTAQRVTLEQQRLAEIERGTQGPLDRLRLQSERECLREKQGEGLVKAMEECKRSSQPFDALALINGQGSLADGRRNIHVVRDAVALLELAEKGLAEKVPGLSGDVIVSDDDYQELLATETFAGKVEYYRQKSSRQWQDTLDQQPGGLGAGKIIAELSLPSVPVSDALIRSLGVLEGTPRALAIAKLSSYWARAQTLNEYGDALRYLELARQLPQLPVEFRTILSARIDYLNAVIARAGGNTGVSEGYRAMLDGIMKDADIARAGLLADSAIGRKEASQTPAELMVSF